MSSNLIICDIQPEYKGSFSYRYVINVLKLILKTLEENGTVYWFWNGPELNMCDEVTLQQWLYDYIVDENLFDLDYNDDLMLDSESDKVAELFNSITFIPKSYGALRCAIDNNYEDESIIYLLKYLIDGAEYSFEANEINLNDLVFNIDIHSDGGVIELIQYLYNSGEYFGFDTTIYDELLKLDYSVEYDLIGGGRFECLQELYLQLIALGYNINIVESLTY